MNKDHLKGKRYLALVRVSNDRDSDTSAEAQLSLLKAFGDEHGMTFAGEVHEANVSGSFPARRKKLESEVLIRKQRDNDFDVLLAQRIDRLTRAGSGHGMWFEYECTKAGITIEYVADDIPETYGALIKVAKLEGSRDQALQISQRGNQCRQAALEKGTCITSSRTPYGCWRLYQTPQGKPSHIIRDLRDGRQEMLNPETHAVIMEFGEVAQTKARGRYKKQKQERPLLIPGDKEQVDVVREIFDLRYRQGIGTKKIAGILNSRRIPSPNRCKWSQNSVEAICVRECYTGCAIGNRVSAARFTQRHAKAPKRVAVSETVAANRAYLPVILRQKEDWLAQEQPLMREFLDPELRILAIKGQQEYWEKRLNPLPERPNARKFDSEYLLTGLLVAKQDGEALTGVLCGRATSRTRYYRHRRGAREYMKGSMYNRMIPAEPLERAVLDFVATQLANTPDLEGRIRKAIADELQRIRAADCDTIELRAQRERMKKRIAFIVTNLDEDTLAEAQDEIGAMRRQTQELDRRIQDAEQRASLQSINVDQVAQRVRARCQDLSSSIEACKGSQLRDLLKIAVDRVVVDMQDKSVEIQLALPSWILQEAPLCSMRSETNSQSSTGLGTHRIGSIRIGISDCQYRLRRTVCYACSRRKAA